MNNWIICLKHGDKYGPNYVNTLFNMTTRHCTVPFQFACITENTQGLDTRIKIIPTPNENVTGWWYKPWVFSNDIPLDGTLLFLDLDIVIVANIDKLWTYEKGKFCIIRDFNRKDIPGYNRCNSSVFRLEKGSYKHIWENLSRDYKQTKLMHGDQDWIYKQAHKEFTFWPDIWIQSYKWEIRSRHDIILDNKKRKFKNIANPIIPQETSLLVFHGDPKPSEVNDPIIVDNWK